MPVFSGLLLVSLAGVGRTQWEDWIADPCPLAPIKVARAGNHSSDMQHIFAQLLNAL
jgi:hypothetical protein